MKRYRPPRHPKANQLANFPLNFLRTGLYNYADGKLYSRTTAGFWWMFTSSSVAGANDLGTDTANVHPQSSYSRGHGFALRCSRSLPATNTDNVAAKANQLANFPLNFLRTGYYAPSDGKLYYPIAYAYWWSNTSISEIHTNALGASATFIVPQNSQARGYGFARRWGAQHFPKANQLANFPLNFLRTGVYRQSNGNIDYRTTHGSWWSATRASATNANYLLTSTTYVYPQYSDYRGHGFALRWAAQGVKNTFLTP